MDKTHSALLAAVCNRVARSLHLPVPSISPYMETPLFYMLPASRFTDRMGRPVAVLTVREVVRDENGKIADLERYTWWSLELLRRMLRDYWVKGKWSEGGRGQGGEGCAVVIDAGGAGYRNIVGTFTDSDGCQQIIGFRAVASPRGGRTEELPGIGRCSIRRQCWMDPAELVESRAESDA